MSKHTPGEWEAWGNGKSKYGVTGPAAAAAFVAKRAMDEAGDRNHYVEMASSSSVPPAIAFGNTKEEAEANARLISAAPELLEACKRLVNCMHLAGWEGDDSTLYALAAIAKAEGAENA